MRSTSQRISTSSIFLALLIGASVWALMQTNAMVSGPAISTSAPSSVTTVRAYYAAVKHFFETGELSGVRDIIDPALFDGANADSGTGNLALHLRGLRETYPALTCSVEELTVSGSTVIARIAIDYGPMSAIPLSPLTSIRTWQQIETFRVSAGRIVDWQSTGLAFGSFVSSAGSGHSLRVHEESTLVAARISFAVGDSGRVAIHAPALLLPERGVVTVRGNGSAIVSSPELPDGQITQPGIDIAVSPEESIFVPQGSAVLSKGSIGAAWLLAFFFIPVHSLPPDHELHADYSSPEQLLADGSGGQIGRGISIELLERGAPTSSGIVQLIAGIALLEPGDGMILNENLESIVMLPRSGKFSIVWDSAARRQLLINEGVDGTKVWIDRRSKA